MKKTIILLAAVSLASAASTAAVSCSLIKGKDEENKDKTANNIEVNENLLKSQIQEYANGKQFNTKQKAINAIQNKKRLKIWRARFNWRFNIW